MMRSLLFLALLSIGCSRPANHHATPQKAPARLELYLPAELIDSSAFLPADPQITLADGSTTRFSTLIQPYRTTEGCHILIWASWCPPDTLPLSNTPLIMLSIDECTPAWQLAIDQLPPSKALHGKIVNPYAAERFLRTLGVHGVPQVVQIKP